jgi:hypothetical protein
MSDILPVLGRSHNDEMDDGIGRFIPGVNCIDCGRFVGRDGHISIEHFEMSSEIASVDGTCRRCIDAAYNREVAAERRHLTELTT